MICALMIGRAGSKGFPGKNVKKVLGRALCEYPLIAAKKSKFVNKIFVSTDCPKIKKISKKYKAKILERPRILASNKALGEDVYKFAFGQIQKQLLKENKSKITFLVLLMANAPTINSKLIDEGFLLEIPINYLIAPFPLIVLLLDMTSILVIYFLLH